MKSKNNSDKPKEILHLEKNYGIILRELNDDEDIFKYENRNSYRLDDTNIIIGLNLAGNAIKDISSFSSLFSSLKELFLRDNQISEISVLRTQIGLEKLNLENNQITDIEPLITLKSLHFLDLSNNQISVISPLSSLNNLIELRLDDNQITDLRPLASLSGLTFLFLKGNQIKDISSLCSLLALTRLGLSINQISDVSPLGRLSGLKQLYLGNNQITDIGPLAALSGLRELWLTNNQLTDVSALGLVSGLTVLGINANQLSDVNGLEALSRLHLLWLSNNQLTDINGLGKLSRLRELWLSNNEITDISPIESLSGLIRLHLENNNIKNISALGSLSSLKYLILSDNILESLDNLKPLKRLKKLQHLKIHNNPFASKYKLGKAFNVNHLDYILNELNRLGEEKVNISLPVKVLLLGNHGSGKSTFLNTLLPESQKVQIGSTHVLNILPYKRNKDTKLPLALFYDFGGQDYYHGIYRAFLTNKSMHLLFWHQETNYIKKQVKDSNDLPNWHYDRDYWIAQICSKQQPKPLENIDKQVIVKEQNDPSIILVQTRADLDNEKQETFHSISYDVQKEFFVSLMPQAPNSYQTHALKCLRAYIEEEIYRQSEVSEESYWYPEFLNFIIQKKTFSPTSLEDIKPHYKRGLDSEEELQRFLKDDLDRLSISGLILYYKDNENLKDFAWLSPEKTVKYVHKHILNKDIVAKNEGRLSENDFKALRLDVKLRQLLLEEKILFYDEKGTKDYIIPNYLPLSSKDDTIYRLLTHGLQAPNFVLKFKHFIPFGYINELICAFGRNEDSKYYWRNEFIFTYKEYKVWIQLLFEDLEIHVSVAPTSLDLKGIIKTEQELFYLLLHLFTGNDKYVYSFIDNEGPLSGMIQDEKDDEILMANRKKNSSFISWLSSDDRLKDVIVNDFYLSKDNINFIDINEINHSKKTLRFYTPYKRTRDLKKGDVLFKVHRDTKERLIRSYDTSIELNDYIPFLNNENIKSTKKIFISYSKDDEAYKNELIDHFYALREEGLISEFNDKQIGLGEKWHERIQKELVNCDYVIGLISPSYFNTAYIREFEIKVAEQLNKKIIPIMIRKVDWTNSIESRYNAPLKAHPIALNRAKLDDGKIISSTIEERDAYWEEIVNKFRNTYLNN